VVVPLTVYQSYGDKRILEEHTRSEGLVRVNAAAGGRKAISYSGFSFGDCWAVATHRIGLSGGHY